MRAVAVALAVLIGSPCAAFPEVDLAKPLERTAPSSDLFFDDAFALAPDGKTVAMLSTDGGNVTHLELWFPRSGARPSSSARATDSPAGIDAMYFLDATHLLLVSKRPGGGRHTARVAEISRDASGARVTIGKRVLGPADTFAVVDEGGKPTISMYRRDERGGGLTHTVELLAADGLRSLGRRTYTESSEGEIRSRIGGLRPLWWSRGHTRLYAQKLGTYDKARDSRGPHTFVQVDTLLDKQLAEQPILDLLGFAKAGLAHEAVPDRDRFVQFSEDQKDLLVRDGLTVRSIALSRPIDVYEKRILSDMRLDGQRLLVALQVDPNNNAALARKRADADDLDLYLIDDTDKASPERRVLVLEGGGSSASFTTAGDRLLVLRRGKGFERGGVALELYALP